MSDFDWNDHPIVDNAGPAAAPAKAAASGGDFSWDDHPVVKASADDADQPDKDRPWYSVTPKGLAAAFKEYIPSLPDTDPNRPFYDVSAKGSKQAAINAIPTAVSLAGSPAGPLGMAAGAAAGESLRSTIQSATTGESPTRKEFYGNVGQAGKMGLAAGMGAEIVPAAVSKAADLTSKVAPWAAAKIGKIFAGVPEETTTRYLEDPEAINTAPERKQIADNLLEFKNKAEERVAQAHDDLAQAKSTLSENKNDVRAGLQDQKFDLQGKLNEAQSAFDEKKQAFREALKSNSLTSMSNEVQGAVGDLKAQVIQGSKDSYGILAKSGGSVPTQPLVDLLRTHIDAMTVNGIPESSVAAQSIQEIQGMEQRLKAIGEELTMPQAKQILQGIDKTAKYSKGAGTFADQTDQAFSELRSTLDQTVKDQVPEYRAKMLEVARKSQLLNKASDLYGTPEKAIGNLNGIASEKGQALHVPMLEALSQETGKDLATPVKGYLLNDKILRTPSLFDQAIEEIPEAKSLNAAKAKLNEVSDPAYSRSKIDQASEPLLSKIQKYQAELEKAKEGKDLFSGVTADTVTGKTKALSGANQYGAELKFGGIDKAYGTDFEKQIQARNDLDQFKKTDTAGARKTLLGAATGGALGYMFDHAIEGLAIGAQAGATADKFSGQAFKTALDKGMSLAEAAKRAGPGAKVITKFGAQAAGATAAGGSGAGMGAAASNPKKGPDKWANDGHDKLLEHSDGTDDQKLIQKNKAKLLADPKAKGLLVKASDLRPGTKAMSNVLERVKDKLAEGE